MTPCKDCITFAICKAQVLDKMSPIEDNNTAHIAMVYGTVLHGKCHLIKDYLATIPTGYSTA